MWVIIIIGKNTNIFKNIDILVFNWIKAGVYVIVTIHDVGNKLITSIVVRSQKLSHIHFNANKI